MKTYQFICVCTVILFLSFGQTTQAQLWNENYWGIYHNQKNVGIGTVASFGIKTNIVSGDNLNTLKLRQTNSSLNSTTYNIYAQHLGGGTGRKVGIYNEVSSHGLGEKIGIWNILNRGEYNERDSYGIKQSIYSSRGNTNGIYQEIFAGTESNNNTGINTIIHGGDGWQRVGNLFGHKIELKLNSGPSSGIAYGSTITIPNKGERYHVGLQVTAEGARNHAGIFNGNVRIHGNLDHKGNVEIDGSLGIGQSVPSAYKLGVAGKIIAEEMVVELISDWPDYVFADDYELMPLEEVETFIERENHLPGIASAEEIQNNGLSLGEIQRKMMEKIEELTLHMISLKKENDILRARLDKLEE